MPSKSLAQNRFVHAMAEKGASWAKKWVAAQHGTKVPKVQHVKKGKKRLKKKVRPPGY